MSDASSRPATLRELVLSLGLAEDEVDRAMAEHTLGLLAVSRFIFPGEARYTQPEMAQLTGMGDDARRYWRALGFPDPGPDERVFTEADVDMLKVVRQLVDLGVVEPEVTLQMARVIGASMARIAAAQIDAIEQRLEEYGPEPGAVLDGEHPEPALLRAGVLQTTMPQILEYAWRRHTQVAARNQMVREATADGTGSPTTVGFADLVGFTALSQQVDDHQLAQIVDRFEVTAYDVVGSHGGRVVKMIGDEVMFTVDDPAAGVEIGLVLAEAYQDDEALSGIRVGLACGSVVGLGGDLFGPTVNLASRIVSIAFEGSVVVSEDLHDSLHDAAGLRWKSLRTRFLKGIGRTRLYVVRRSTDADEGALERANRLRGALRDRVTDMLDPIADRART